MSETGGAGGAAQPRATDGAGPQRRDRSDQEKLIDELYFRRDLNEGPWTTAMVDVAGSQDRAERSMALHYALSGFGREVLQVDDDRAELHGALRLIRGEHDKPGEEVAVLPAPDDAEVDPLSVVRLQRGRHVVVVGEELPVRLRHRLRADLTHPRDEQSGPRVELI